VLFRVETDEESRKGMFDGIVSNPVDFLILICACVEDLVEAKIPASLPQFGDESDKGMTLSMHQVALVACPFSSFCHFREPIVVAAAMGFSAGSGDQAV